MRVNRRTFVQTMAVAGTACAVGCRNALAKQRARANLMFGLCASPEKAEKLKAVGFSFIEGGVGSFLKPDTPDADYAPQLAKLRACALPIRSCNGFIPSKFKLTGPDLAHDAALDYAAKACERADAIGIPFIVLGSGGARKIPDGFDHEKGNAQFIEFCKKLGDRIAKRNVTIVLEPLNKGETNLLNSVAEGVGFVDAIQSPRVQLLADFYHMMRENEGPESIRKAGARLRHCHIAELEKRMAPGTKGEDFTGFLKALKDIGYVGGVSCECSWPKENIEAAWQKALDTLRTQTAKA